MGQPGTIVLKNVLTASPPIHAWMPNHPHATSARISAGTFEPNVPYAARAKWVALESQDALPAAEIKKLLRKSYELVLAKLPKKTQAALG